MACRLLNYAKINNVENNIFTKLFVINNVRHGHTIRGKPPGVARSLKQRLQDENVANPVLEVKINIGFPQLKLSRTQQVRERLSHLRSQRNNSDLEKLSRSNKLEINLEEVRNDWLHTSGPFHQKVIAEHYGIFQHLFGDAYFVPRIPLNISYKQTEEKDAMVYNGNLLKPSEAKNQPNVNFNHKFNIHSNKDDDNDSLFTLIMTNPDSHLTENNQEYCHWFVCNIKEGQINKSDLIIPYIQPFPAKGIGYQRNIFILYKQEKFIDFGKYKVSETNDLKGRTFSTEQFYRKYQDIITPAGLAFFQCDWEKSLTDFYHNVLGIKEPIYEYDFPKAYIKEQTYFPLKQPFNLYMDKYRDPKQISKEYLSKKLLKTHPFNGPDKPLLYPNAHPIKNVPSWLRTEMKKNRLGQGRINDV